MKDNAHTALENYPKSFRRTFRVRLAMLTVGLLANILMLADLFDVVPGVIIFASSVIVYTGMTAAFWKCPHCKKYPGNAVMPDYCERCGEAVFGLDAHIPDLAPEKRRSILPLRYVLLGRGAYGILLFLYFVLAGRYQTDHAALFWIGAFLMLSAGVWIEWRWWRCPHCGGYLKKSIWPGRACAKCGEQLHY
jgi:hypothetical protein